MEHGLRAQIKSSNLLTGQSEIALEFIPNAPKATISTEGNIIVFPAVPGTFADISRTASELLSQINQKSSQPPAPLFCVTIAGSLLMRARGVVHDRGLLGSVLVAYIGSHV